MTPKYPGLTWVRGELRYNIVAPVRYKVLEAYIVGSEARGTATAKSDLDIAVVIPRVRGKSSEAISNRWHGKFENDSYAPRWGDRLVDFEFFYPDDPELQGYAKIRVKK